MYFKIYNNKLTVQDRSYSIVGANETEETKWLTDYLTGDVHTQQRVWLEFDTIDECTTGGSATVTKYPTENGILATDYKYKNPDTVTMVGIIADSGITGLSTLYRVMGKWDRKTAVEAIRTNLDTLVGNMTLLNIQTRNAGRRTNMTLTAYEINETYDTFGTMQVTMQFQQVPQFDGSGAVSRNASDTDTTDTGIMNTQSLLAIGGGTLAVGGIVAGNIAALD